MESPLRPAAPGFESDFARSASGLSVVILAAICLAVIFLSVFAHVYARLPVNKWIFHDYFYCLSCLLGVVYITFSIPLGLAEPFGKHVWDIDTAALTKSYMSLLHASTISTGPILWLTKVAVFGFIARTFNAPRWFKHSMYIGIIFSGIVFSQYTIAVVLACAPKPDDNLESYVNGFRAKACSSPNGAHMIIGILTSVFNCLTDIYLLAAAIFMCKSLKDTIRQQHVIYVLYLCGCIACLCSFVTMVFRIRSWQDSDLTGYQVPLDASLILEIVLSLSIPAMPSIYSIWKSYTHVEIIEKSTIGAPSTIHLGSHSTISTMPSTPAPSHHTRSGWRKTHLSIEELPYRKQSLEYYRNSPIRPLSARMKALPATPLPAPKTPNSPISMRLPIVLETPFI